MTNKGGWNPMRWDCVKYGCFNDKRRPKIEVFSECFPGNINFGDIDGIVEISGNMLLLEWKTVQHELPVGQKILYERMTKSSPITVMIVIGDAETMEVSAMCVLLNGVRSPKSGYDEADLSIVKEWMKDWCAWACSNPFLGSP